MMRGKMNWGGATEILVGNFATLVAAQALQDRVPSSATNKQSAANQRAMITAGAAGLLGVGGVVLGLVAGADWAANLGLGLMAGATGLGGQLGMADVDERLGLKDPPVTPEGFAPPAPVTPPNNVIPFPAPQRLATGADWMNAIS